MKTLLDLFYKQARAHADKACIKVHDPENGPDDYTVSYEQFFSLLVRNAALLKEKFNLSPGDTIALLDDNSPGYLILIYAAAISGIKTLLLSTRSLPEHVKHLTRGTDCKTLFSSPGYKALYSGSGCEIAGLDFLSLATEVSPADKTDKKELEQFVSASNVQDTDTALIICTSGTTRLPRAVPITHRNILSNQKAMDLSIKEFWTGQDSSLAWLPLFHGYTSIMEFIRDIYAGATFILYRSTGTVTANDIIDAVKSTRATILCCVPWMLKLVQEKISGELASGNSASLDTMRQLHYIVTGGAPAEKNTTGFYAGQGINLVTFFGLTETAGIILYSDFTGENPELLQPTADDSIQFREAEPGSGEFELTLVNSDLVSPSAATETVPSSSSEPELVFHTNDLFMPVAGGWSYIGRNDQLYNGPQGEKVNPLHFEKALEQMGGVARVFVSGEELLFNAALVELLPGRNPEALREEITSRVQEVINPGLEQPARVYPNDIILLKAGQHIPLTPKGTINRGEALKLLKALVSENTEPGGIFDLDSIRDLLMAEVTSYLEEYTEIGLSGDKTLLELGFDSLKALSLRNSLGRKLDLEIPIELALRFPSLESLAENLYRLKQHQSPTANAEPVKPEVPEESPTQDWSPIQLEQVVFHTAHYIFPFPTYNVSMSLLAPGLISLARIKEAIRFLEQKHDILRSVYQADGTYKIEERSFVDEALLGETGIEGTHDIHNNAEAQAIIQEYLNGSFDLNTGPVYRFALVNITGDNAGTKSMIYLGLNHTVGDFKGFNFLISELMEYLEGKVNPGAIQSDHYQRRIPAVRKEDLAVFRESWQKILTVPPVLKEGMGLRDGKQQYFNFPEIRLKETAAVLSRHNISLFNGLYALYILVLSKYLPGQSVDDFLSATTVTTRVSAETEDLMGCFIHSPVLRFHLDGGKPMHRFMEDVQHTTMETFIRLINDPVGYINETIADPANMVPILNRNVFLYRSPEEQTHPLSGWECYRNEFFFDQSDVGLYFDCCASPKDGAMEGYVLINLNYLEPGVIEPIIQDMRKLVRRITESASLDFDPAGLIA